MKLFVFRLSAVFCLLLAYIVTGCQIVGEKQKVRDPILVRVQAGFEGDENLNCEENSEDEDSDLQAYLEDYYKQQDASYSFVPNSFSPKPEDYFREKPVSILDGKAQQKWLTHKVRKGETLTSIARKYHVSVKNLRQLNQLKGHRLKLGKEIKILFVSSEIQSSSNLQLAELWDDELAKTLAVESYQYGSTVNRKGHCLRGVRIAMTKSLQKLGLIDDSERVYLGRSAHSFGAEAVADFGKLCKKHRLIPITGENATPEYPGLIYIYNKGRCGFSRKHGHIETVVSTNPTIVCSDHCREFDESRCSPNLVLAPSRMCPDSTSALGYREAGP